MNSEWSECSRTKERRIEWVKRHYKFNDYCYIHFKDSYVCAWALPCLFCFFFRFLLLLILGDDDSVVVVKCNQMFYHCKWTRKWMPKRDTNRNSVCIYTFNVFIKPYLDHWHRVWRKNKRIHKIIHLNCRCASALYNAFTYRCAFVFPLLSSLGRI